MRLPLLILLSALIAFPAQAATLPSPFTAVYALKKGPIIIGETRRSLIIDNEGNNIFESVTRPRGVAKLITRGQIVERSRWIVQQDRLTPLEYTYFNTGSEQSHDVHLYFDWQAHTITNTINGDPWHMPLVDGAQDRLLYQLQLMQDLQDGKTKISYPVADGGKLKTYALERMGVETITTPLGTFETVRLRLVHGKRQTTIWCAATLDFLPVRIEQRTEDEGPLNAVLESVKGLRTED